MSNTNCEGIENYVEQGRVAITLGVVTHSPPDSQSSENGDVVCSP